MGRFEPKSTIQNKSVFVPIEHLSLRFNSYSSKRSCTPKLDGPIIKFHGGAPTHWLPP